MKRIAMLVDGYNLYHAIDHHCHIEKNHRFKWLNLWKLSELLVRDSNQHTIEAVHYFSAYAKQKPEAYARHRAYVAALEHAGVTIHLGNFKKKPRSCRSCGTQWEGYEEKETDVNIAITLISMAYMQRYDTVILLTADTDICPAIKMAKTIAPDMTIILAIPPASKGRNPKCSALVGVTDDSRKVSFDMINQARLAEKITLAHGKIIHCPEKYR
jgi:uncharacterized LabA/DUF88 family protein